jgi:hypothetical protein
MFLLGENMSVAGPAKNPDIQGSLFPNIPLARRDHKLFSVIVPWYSMMCEYIDSERLKRHKVTKEGAKKIEEDKAEDLAESYHQTMRDLTRDIWQRCFASPEALQNPWDCWVPQYIERYMQLHENEITSFSLIAAAQCGNLALVRAIKNKGLLQTNLKDWAKAIRESYSAKNFGVLRMLLPKTPLGTIDIQTMFELKEEILFMVPEVSGLLSRDDLMQIFEKAFQKKDVSLLVGLHNIMSPADLEVANQKCKAENKQD